MRTASYSNGAKVSGKLKSTYGKKVYYQGRVDFNNWTCSDSGAIKYGSTTASKTGITTGGSISMITTSRCASGGSKVQSRILEDRGLLPDPSGPWSAKY